MDNKKKEVMYSAMVNVGLAMGGAFLATQVTVAVLEERVVNINSKYEERSRADAEKFSASLEALKEVIDLQNQNFKQLLDATKEEVEANKVMINKISELFIELAERGAWMEDMSAWRADINEWRKELLNRVSDRWTRQDAIRDREALERKLATLEKLFDEYKRSSELRLQSIKDSIDNCLNRTEAVC